nr:hypothetical protein CFP56_63017 [Quercus suber]
MSGEVAVHIVSLPAPSQAPSYLRSSAASFTADSSYSSRLLMENLSTPLRLRLLHDRNGDDGTSLLGDPLAFNVYVRLVTARRTRFAIAGKP